jgi:heptosyltransferase-2
MTPGVAEPASPLPRDVERLLVICPSWVGDTVMATPVLRAVRAHCPDARVVAAMRPGLDDVLRGVAWIDEPRPLRLKGPLGPLPAGRALRRDRPDAVLLLPNSFRSAVAARLSGAPVRIGYDRDRRGRLLTHRLPVERSAAPTPAVAYYARLGAFACGVDEIDPTVELAVTDDERAAATRLLDGVGERFLLLNPGANKPAKRWPAERFARAADELRETHGLDVVVSGGPGETDLTAAVARAARGPVTDLARRGVDLGALKAIIARAALVITNDTGPRHLAAALGTPVVSLFGPTDHRWTTLGHPREHLVLAAPFLPEEQVADRHPRRCAIERITVADVRGAAAALLDADPGTSPAGR